MGRDLKAFGVVVIKAFCAFVVMVSTIFTFYTVGPSLETRWWPVVSKLEILSSQPAGENRTAARVAFRKLRDCEFLGIAWYIGDRPADFERVPVILLRDQDDTGSPNRPMGYQRAGPWVIGVPFDKLRTMSFARLTHRCHPFWNSVTDFYP